MLSALVERHLPSARLGDLTAAVERTARRTIAAALRGGTAIRAGRLGTALVGGLVIAMLAACASSPPQALPTAASSLGRSPTTVSFSEADIQRAVDELASIGIETRVRPSDPAPITAVTGDPSPVHLLRLQVRNLALERAAGGGTRGADLDRLSAAAGGGQVTPLVAGWAASGTTLAAKWAASLLGPKAPADSAARVFPTLALVAFVSDARSASGRTSGGTTGGVSTILQGSTGGGGERAFLTVATTSDFCTEVSSYLSAALNGIVDSKADVPATLKQLIDLYAPQYANDPGLLRRTIGALALMTYATSLARPWTVNVVPDPLAVAYGIEGQDPVEGDVQASVSAGKDVLAPEVAECASLANAQLASIPVAGSSVTWDPSGLGVHAKAQSAEAKLDENSAAGLTYETTSESKDVADNGDPVTVQMWVDASVDRSEMSALAAVVKSILTGDVAGTPAGSTVKTLYQAMEPTLNAVMRPSGFAVIDVTHHTPKAPASPTAAPSAPASAALAAAVNCALVSAADLESVASAASVKLVSEAEPAPGLAVCEWQINPNGVGAVNIATGPMAEAVSARTWAQFKNEPAVSGVGDEAHWDATAQTLEVKFGTGYASFALFGPTVGDARAAAISLAKLVLPKLGG